MTAINPNTTIYAINVPLTPFSEDTILFTTLDQQRQYFYDRKVTILTNYTYQREHRNWLKVTDPNGLIDKCNYLMFVNESYENKRMYAWITNVNWINNETCEIQYEMDYVQTFLFDIYNRGAGANHLPTCWVERQHGYTDAIGDNIQPENVNLGEYKYNDTYKRKIDLSDGVAVFGVSRSNGRIYDNIFSGVELKAYDLTVGGIVDIINAFLASHADQNDILFAYIVPKYILNAYSTNNYTITAKTSIVQTTDLDVAFNPTSSNPVTLNGYLPKNKKLYTYPYNFFVVSDGNGNNLKLRYEFMTLHQPRAQIEFAVSPPAMLKLYPYRYKWSGNGNANVYKEECLTITNFPMISWSYDAFAQWVGRSLTANIIKVAATAVGAGVAYAIGMPAVTTVSTLLGNMPDADEIKAQNKYKTQATQAGVVAGANAIGSILSHGYQAAIEGDISNGSFTSSGSDFATGSCGIYTARASIDGDIAETIDNYFTAYGYAQNKLMQPNPEARMYYTYIKTTNININGAMPIDAKAQITARFNSGIRFWRDYTHFLDYTVTNSPRG